MHSSLPQHGVFHVLSCQFHQYFSFAGTGLSTGADTVHVCNSMPTVKTPVMEVGVLASPTVSERPQEILHKQAVLEGRDCHEWSQLGLELVLSFEGELLGCSLFIIKLRTHPSLVFPFQYQLSPYVGEEAGEQCVRFPEFVLALHSALLLKILMIRINKHYRC